VDFPRHRIPLTSEALQYLPDGAAVYILWVDDTPMYCGAVSASQGLAAELIRQIRRELTGGYTHFSFEQSEDPLGRCLDISAELARLQMSRIRA
jgi:hypothetical protein